ncbi:3D-(3,5/4)-trihydroxycyclohexane-1,2-dione acylhydrolase (decyclizing) [Rhodobacteraceae bacterium]|nr:3D-(3,5/4)-trihydroxycyclohexane-1,2-dione acylhydrolase (decyclizing) [Paracoccaceae bacterium]
MRRKTIRLTMAQALVRYLCNQFTEIDGERVQLFAGVFGIFGHGNVTCLGEALEAVQEQLPTWRGQNEQSMALAAIGFAKAKLRRQLMIATSSVGPGATNMVTAAGVAHSNRLPVLLISGDTFANRRPDPVLQQVEHFGNPTLTVNDSFKAVTRYWDRISHPEQIISSLPQAIAAMLDPADCGPAFIGLCQDTQEIAFDYPEVFFEATLHTIPRPRPDRVNLASAVQILKSAKRPLIIAGGGVKYSLAGEFVGNFAMQYKIPLCETISGKGAIIHEHPAYVGGIGVTGSSSANAMAASADVILAIGTRLQDFTTGSWTAFSDDAKFISINAARWDAVKHRALSVVGDALETIKELNLALTDWSAPEIWMEKGRKEMATWNAIIDEKQKPTNAILPSYAQIIKIIHDNANDRDLVITAAGGPPGEVNKGWRVKSPNTVDTEFGFSCMGYEIPAGWGAAMADKTRTPIVIIGDGTYMMMNSDIYSSVLSGHKMIVIIPDNGGFAIINRLQNFKGGASFNNLIKDSRVKEPFSVDFAKHAESMGAEARRVETLDELNDAMKWAQENEKTTVLTIPTDAFEWTPGDADWDVGVPQISDRKEVNEARVSHDVIRSKQRIGV